MPNTNQRPPLLFSDQLPFKHHLRAFWAVLPPLPTGPEWTGRNIRYIWARWPVGQEGGGGASFELSDTPFPSDDFQFKVAETFETIFWGARILESPRSPLGYGAYLFGMGILWTLRCAVVKGGGSRGAKGPFA